MPFQGKCNVCSRFTQRNLTDEHWRFTVINKRPLVYQRVNTPGCQHAVKLSTSCQGEKIFFAQTRFLESTNQKAQKFPKIKKDESFQVAVRKLSRGCQEAVKRLSGKNHHNFEAKIKFGRWFRHHRRAYSTPSVLTPAKFDLHFRLSRGCSPSDLLIR